MKFLDEYRDAGLAQQFAREIHRITTRPWTIMEVCGGQTHAIVKFGIDELLPEKRGFYRHNILFQTGTEISVVFQRFCFEVQKATASKLMRYARQRGK